MFLGIGGNGKYAANRCLTDRASPTDLLLRAHVSFAPAPSSSRRRCIHHLPLLVSRRHRRKAKRFRSVESSRRCRAFASYRRAASRRSRHSPRARSSACHLTSPDADARRLDEQLHRLIMLFLCIFSDVPRVVNQRCCSTARPCKNHGGSYV